MQLSLKGANLGLMRLGLGLLLIQGTLFYCCNKITDNHH